MNNGLITTLIISIFGAGGLISAAIVSYRAIRLADINTKQEEIKKDVAINSEKIEVAKTQAITEAEKAKTQVEANTKYVDAAFSSLQEQVKTMQGENKTKAQDMLQLRREFSEVRSSFNSCLDDKASMKEQLADVKIEHGYTKAQLESLKNYQKALRKALEEVDPSIYDKIKKYMLEYDSDNVEPQENT